ncbi:hypothetical protein FNL39_1062 [Nocardia caishijiensis]|uniref:Uncharacterized protein n=2 Tax=Nocardia caishijiensis TaxID=184756 RepID=A0ABQ6YIK2_9NOCA|nr:hypothetical protein FNL39_1062 [Nocardia caishijiensis]
MDELSRAADLFALGELPDRDLTMIAAEALARGLDSPALIELACLHRDDDREASELFRAAVNELGLLDIASWSEREVSVRLGRATRHAAALLNDEGDPVEHLRVIDAELFSLANRFEPEVPELVSLADDFSQMSMCLEQGYSDAAQIWDDVRRGCRNLLAGSPYEPVYERVDLSSYRATAPEPPVRPKSTLRARIAALFRG